jgi:hypothetical protein
VHVQAGGEGLLADVTPGSAAALGLGPGRAIWAAIKATEVAVYGVADASASAAGETAPLPSRHV